jgi:hypothetical protein
LVQTVSASSGGSGTLAHRSASYYDVQLGITFTQSFAYLAYNVTAVAQSDVNGFGPGYLLNGLSDQGYWYQVGISWNWPYASGGYTSGFNMNYEAFDSNGNSVFPASGGGGLTSLSGAVNDGDSILLSLSFSGGNVVLYAFDWNTGASAQEAYTAHGATTFVGETGGPDNGNGLFTGLMTEWWHSAASIGTTSPVIYTNSTTTLSSGWLWADDWNPDTGVTIFSDYRYLAFSNPSQLQYFTTNGTAVAADGYEFITDAVSAVSAVSEVPLTFSFSVVGGGVDYSSPILTYVSNGSTLTATLGSTLQSYSLDVGSVWSVNASLPGSNSTERWDTSQTTSGTVSATQTISFTYYHQFDVVLSYSVIGGGSPTVPTLTATQFGGSYTPTLTGSPTGYWLDAGASFSVPDPLQGSSSTERWYTNSSSSGSVSAAASMAPVYYHQYTIVYSYNVSGEGSPSSLELNYSSLGSPSTSLLDATQGTAWADSGSTFSFDGVAYASSSERWSVLAQATTGSVSSAIALSPIYYHQYDVQILSNAEQGGLVSPQTGWYNSSEQIQLSATPNEGWQFEFWNASGTGSYDGTNNPYTVTVQNPTVESAVFYPGLSVVSSSMGSVSYGSASLSGEVGSSSNKTLFVPSGSTVQLTASPALFLFKFVGWSGATSSGQAEVSTVVNSPESLQATFSIDWINMSILIAIILVAVGIVLWRVLLTRRPSKANSQTEALQ